MSLVAIFQHNNWFLTYEYEKNSELKSKPKDVPSHTRLKLWVKTAGRCEFRGCNKPVWRNNLTLSDGNFGEVAHIIGASKDGPRGE